ncbi:MAG: tyrosine-type recombinase/integrase [Acholeplasmataceae bacterium]|nr:tyrosine-type recombinase/integrase [Acholeplasmataceae bacterium]
MNLFEMLNKYHTRSTAIKSRGTIHSEEGHVTSLERCLRALNLTEPSDLSEDVGYRMITWYKEKTNNSNNSINKRMAHLKRVLRYFKVETTFYNLSFLKKDTLPYRRFQDNELKRIFKFIDLSMESPAATSNTILYKLMIYMLLDTGLRISELLDIKIPNIDLNNQIIFLEHTKNGKKEPIPFSDFSDDLIRQVIDLQYDDVYLFWNHLKDRQMNYQNDVRNFMRRLKQKTGLDRLHPHRFRKSYGTMIYQESKDIRLVQKLLRHAELSTTEIYISEGIEEIHSRYHKFSKVFSKRIH